MDAGLLDTLVKLASLGAGGVCVLAIFWVGWLILQPPDTASKEKHKTLRMFMGMTIIIAVIAFASGIANAWFNANALAKVEQEKTDAVTQAKEIGEKFDAYKEEARATITKLGMDKVHSRTVAESLERVVGEKELMVRDSANGVTPELQSHIRILLKSIHDLKATTPDGNAVNPP